MGAGSVGDMTSDLRTISISVGDSFSVMPGWYPGHERVFVAWPSPHLHGCEAVAPMKWPRIPTPRAPEGLSGNLGGAVSSEGQDRGATD